MNAPEGADFLALKVLGAVAAAGAVFGDVALAGAALPFFGVSISTVGMSAAGSMIAFAYGTPVESRRKLYGYAIGGTFIGVWGVQLLLWRGVDVPLQFQPPVAGVIALISRWAVPVIVENLAVIGSRLFGKGAK